MIFFSKGACQKRINLNSGHELRCFHFIVLQQIAIKIHKITNIQKCRTFLSRTINSIETYSIIIIYNEFFSYFK